MKEDFKKHLSRIKSQTKHIFKAIKELSLSHKIFIGLIFVLMLPALPFLLIVGAPAIVSLFFLKEKLDGIQRGLIAFSLATVSHVFVLYILFNFVSYSEASMALSMVLIIRATLGGILLLATGYMLCAFLYGLKLKQLDGKTYIILFGLLSLLLAFRNSWVVLRK